MNSAAASTASLSPKPSAFDYSTPSKRSAAQVESPTGSGPVSAVKKRRRTAAAACEAPAPVPRDVTCNVCLEPVAAACKPSECGHLLCYTCAHGLWCCPQCRAEVTRPCPTCRRETFFDDLECDRNADSIALTAAKNDLSSVELAQWRQRKKDGRKLSERQKRGSVPAMQLEIAEERSFVHAVVVSRSPTSRAICACCSEQISSGTLRVHQADGRFSHVTCHDMEAEINEVCAGERVGLGEVHVSIETNIVDSKLMRPDPMELRRADPEQLCALRHKLTNAAGMSQWFWHVHLNTGNIWGHAADQRLGLAPELTTAQSPRVPLSPIGTAAPSAAPFVQLMAAMVFGEFDSPEHHDEWLRLVRQNTTIRYRGIHMSNETGH